MALRKVKNDTINGNCLSKEQQYIEKQKAIEASKKQEYKNKPLVLKRGVTGKNLKKWQVTYHQQKN